MQGGKEYCGGAECNAALYGGVPFGGGVPTAWPLTAALFMIFIGSLSSADPRGDRLRGDLPLPSVDAVVSLAGRCTDGECFKY